MEVSTADGTISVTLNNPTANPNSLADDYRVAAPSNNQSTITVQNDDIPTITIEAASETLAGNFAMFKLTSSIEPFEALTIKYTPENTSNNFLATTDSDGNSTSSFGRWSANLPALTFESATE